jgi:hypothetical protein
LILDQQPTAPKWIDIQEELIRLTIPEHPAHSLEIHIRHDDGSALLEPLTIKVAKKPHIDAQVLKIYDGEAAIVRGAGFFDQLDLSCNYETIKAAARTINSTAIACPASIFKSEPGAPSRSRRQLLISSESMEALLTPGIPPSVSVELTPLPYIMEQSEPAESAFPVAGEWRTVVFAMSGVVLDREIVVWSSSGSSYECERLPGWKLQCILPASLFDQDLAALKLSLWPGGPLVDTKLTVRSSTQIRLSKLHPQVLVAGVPG